MRKKVDVRIRTLIENGVKLRHRSMFVMIGDKSRDQIVNLHFMLSKSVVKSRPTVLWCYKDKLELSSHKKKRAKQVKKLMQRGLLDPEKVDPFSLFVESANITYCLYKDSERILGNTFGMCILQDFEALTPNLLARTIETVEGGGLILLLLRSLKSLTSLCTMTMDVHERFRTESHSQSVVGRFNERFLLSIASCKACVVMDDELNILEISSHVKSIQPVMVLEDPEGLSEREREFKNLQGQFLDDFPVGPLIGKCCTMDQGKAVITFLEAILDKALRNIVALIASRGRGKSAALGLAVAGAIALGFSNIFVTAPSPDNLKTFFEFVCKGLNTLEYKEHLHYSACKSTDPQFMKATIQINIYKQHRQTVQYVKPQDHGKLSQVELLVIDEAAAIPLPIVKCLLGPYLVFLSSTVNGYEGTGRSLSLKLLQQLESQSQIPTQIIDGSHSGILFKKIELSESIRYASGDPIESWLHDLLCLDVASYIPHISCLPHPSKCNLFYVNRDTLFSRNEKSEIFLQRMMALYVASHYKNSPNDLQLMADAPAHHLFVLLGPVDESKNQLPDDIICVIQVCLEGQILKESARKSLREGHQPFGDQIPWKFCEQFQDDCFPTFSGARIVRIAVHPSALRLGYGTAAVELLTRYYEGQFSDFTEVEEDHMEEQKIKVTEAAEEVSLLKETIKPRTDLPYLFLHLRERRPEKLHWLGVSFGLTRDLFSFWRKHKFNPFYICQIPSAVTSEHACMVLKTLNLDESELSGPLDMTPFYDDFKQRFCRLLSSTFRNLDYKLAMSILAPKISFIADVSTHVGVKSPSDLLSPYDMKRLQAYTNNIIDFRTILDLVPVLAHGYFQQKLPVTLSSLQASVLLCIGLQNQDLTYIKEHMKIEREQILAIFFKVMKKFHGYLYSVATKDIESTRPHQKQITLTPHAKSLDEELKEAAKEVMEKLNSENKKLDPEFLRKYAITDEIDSALQNSLANVSGSGVVSIKSSATKTTPPKDTSKREGREKIKSKSSKNKSNSQKRRKVQRELSSGNRHIYFPF